MVIQGVSEGDVKFFQTIARYIHVFGVEAWIGGDAVVFRIFTDLIDQTDFHTVQG